MSWADEELVGLDLGDARLDRRLVRIVQQLADKPAQSVPQACGSATAAKAVYRLWDNDDVSDESIRAAHSLATCARCFAHPVVLAIQDTTSLDFTGHPATAGLGYLETRYVRGLKVHSTLAVSEDGVPLGLLHQQVWVRDDAELGKKKQRRAKATADKESQHWLDALQATQQALSAVPCVITLADSEADIFDLLALPRRSNSHLLIRAAQNRRVEGETDGVFGTLARSPARGVETIRLEKAKREAVLTLRHTTARIRPPKNGRHGGQSPIAVHAILVQEESPPAGTEALGWRLLTMLPLESVEDVRRCVRLYCRRWLIEIVFPQLTKTHVLGFPAGRDHIANLHLLIGHDHAIDQQFHQFALRLEAGPLQTTPHALAELLDRRGQRRQVGATLGLVFQLPRLLRQGLAPLFQRATSAFVFGQRNDVDQVRLGQALELVFQTELALAELLASGLQFLRQPVPAMGPLQRVHDLLRLGQHRTQVLPDQLIERMGRGVTCRALHLRVTTGQMRSAWAQVIVIAWMQGAAGAAQPAVSAAHQRPQQIGVRRVMTTGKLAVEPEAGLDLFERLRRDDGRNARHRDPFFPRHRHLTETGLADRVGSYRRDWCMSRC
jgi:hypothetical protein